MRKAYAHGLARRQIAPTGTLVVVVFDVWVEVLNLLSKTERLVIIIF